MNRQSELLIAGAVVIVGGAAVSTLILASRIRTGHKDVDRLASLVAFNCLANWGPLAITDPRYGRACMTIIYKESRGLPKNYVHDLTASGGPGVGPMAVNRLTAMELGLWSPRPNVSLEQQRADYLELAQDEAWGVKAGVRVFRDKLIRAKGDFAEGLRRYNGSGAAAEAYKADALSFIGRTWGGFA